MFEREIIYSHVWASVHEEERDEALESGWAENRWVNDKTWWYPCRSTRINIKNHKKNRKDSRLREKCSSVSYEIKNITDTDSIQLKKIEDEHLKHKNFKDFYRPPIFDDKYLAVLYKENEICHGYSIWIESKKSYEIVEFYWDYHEPAMYLGKFNILCGIDICKDHSKKYLYIGDGYEKGCLYKNQFKGFEYWTGEEWSGDKKQYHFLCERDSALKTIEDLSNIPQS